MKNNQPSENLKSKFVYTSLEELLADECIKQVEQRPHIFSPLSVVENSSGKQRLLVNLRYLNKY